MKQSTKLKMAAAGGLVIAGMQSMLSTPVANAAPIKTDAHTHDEYVVCAQLESDPTIDGVTNIAKSMMQVMDSKTAADTVADAVTYVCPKYAPLVNNWIRAYGHSTATNPNPPASPNTPPASPPSNNPPSISGIQPGIVV